LPLPGKPLRRWFFSEAATALTLFRRRVLMGAAARGQPSKVVGHVRCASRAVPTLCKQAESCAASGLGPLAIDLFVLFSEYIQILANSKICVGFIWTQKIMKQILLDRS
jgi:hypothetical protein